jgi:hypothetical protein
MAEDIVRPLCRCHGEPMLKDGHWRGVQKWQCRIIERARQAQLYAEKGEHQRAKMRHHWRNGGREVAQARHRDRKAQGLCVRCKGPILSESLCWDCLTKREEYVAVRI